MQLCLVKFPTQKLKKKILFMPNFLKGFKDSPNFQFNKVMKNR